MTKKNLAAGKTGKITYWIATIWLALGMLSTGIVQIIKWKEEVAMMAHLGYPAYFLTLLGIWKILGVIAVLIPKFPLLKEWAYAGFFFAMSGAIFSHIASGDGIKELFGPTLLLILQSYRGISGQQLEKILKIPHNHYNSAKSLHYVPQEQLV